MKTKVKIHKDEFECVRVQLRPEHLVLLYAHSVAVPHMVYQGVLFRMEALLVDVNCVLEIDAIFQDLCIIPNYERSPEFYNIVNESLKNE